MLRCDGQHYQGSVHRHRHPRVVARRNGCPCDVPFAIPLAIELPLPLRADKYPHLASILSPLLIAHATQCQSKANLQPPCQCKGSSKEGRAAGEESAKAGNGAASPASSTVKAPPPPAPPLLQFSAKFFASFSLASQVLSVGLSSASFLSFHSVKSHRWLGHDLQATDLPFLIPVPLVGTASHAADPLTSVAPPLSRLANAVPSLALSPFIPSLPTDQLCVCALQVEGRGGGQHRRFPTPLPCGRAGTHGDGREAALPIAATRESTGPERGRDHRSKGRTQGVSRFISPPLSRPLTFPIYSLRKGGSIGAKADRGIPLLTPHPPPPLPTSRQRETSWQSARPW
ncbi:unnamed protein product [Closterium sp. NIES-65]|nr:unnamed protein product [Closterium sp. NIES-65]